MISGNIWNCFRVKMVIDHVVDVCTVLIKKDFFFFLTLNRCRYLSRNERLTAKNVSDFTLADQITKTNEVLFTSLWPLLCKMCCATQ